MSPYEILNYLSTSKRIKTSYHGQVILIKQDSSKNVDEELNDKYMYIIKLISIIINFDQRLVHRSYNHILLTFINISNRHACP